MKIKLNEPLRLFQTGLNNQVTLTDCGSVYLGTDEMITLADESGAEYDVCKKAWGYYATPSINGRLKKFGFKTALVRNSANLLYIMLVKEEKIELFLDYLQEDNQEVVAWLDEDTEISL